MHWRAWLPFQGTRQCHFCRWKQARCTPVPLACTLLCKKPHHHCKSYCCFFPNHCQKKITYIYNVRVTWWLLNHMETVSVQVFFFFFHFICWLILFSTCWEENQGHHLNLFQDILVLIKITELLRQYIVSDVLHSMLYGFSSAHSIIRAMFLRNCASMVCNAKFTCWQEYFSIYSLERIFCWKFYV